MKTVFTKKKALAAAVLLCLASSQVYAQTADNSARCVIEIDAGGGLPPTTTGDDNNFACGQNANASGPGATSIGASSSSNGAGATATGAFSRANGNDTTANGSQAVADGLGNSAFGAESFAGGTNNTAAGAYSSVNSNVTNAGAFGAGSMGDRDNAISFGNSTVQRQQIDVAAGSQDTDAVNVAQLRELMRAFGGGANFTGGIYGSPSFAFLSGGNFDNVNDALLYLDGRITRISLTPGPQGPQGPQGPAGTGDCTTAVCYDDDSRRTATLNEGGGATRLRNVDAGISATDAVNLGQMQAGDINTLNQANSYTDSRISNVLNVWNDKFDAIDSRISQMGAMNTAMTMMTSSAAGVPGANRAAVGVGFQGGEAAIAAGYQRAFRNGAVLTFGVSYSGGETTTGGGFGFGF